MIDPVKHLASKKLLTIEFIHVPTDKSVIFPALVTKFSDSFQSSWNDENVYGRMDPISTFEGTTRTISIDWDVVAANIEETVLNLGKVSKLVSMLYPTYSEQTGGATTISASPLFRVKFVNFVQANGGAGLLGKFSGFTFTPDFDAGFFDPGAGQIYPKVINMSGEFTVLHEVRLGWTNGEFRSAAFPYGTDLEGTERSNALLEEGVGFIRSLYFGDEPEPPGGKNSDGKTPGPLEALDAKTTKILEGVIISTPGRS